MFFSQDPEADRAFFRDVLEFPSIDIGRGWLLFQLPRSEAAVHPARDNGVQMYLMCDDLASAMKAFEAKNVRCTQVAQEAWGTRTTLHLPSGGEIGLYQPSHPTALGLGSSEGD